MQSEIVHKVVGLNDAGQVVHNYVFTTSEEKAKSERIRLMEKHPEVDIIIESLVSRKYQ